jgi:methyl-accepting chemotaxis protein
MLKNIKLAPKLIGSFVIVALVSVFICLIGISNMAKMNASAAKLYYQVTIPLEEIGNVSIAFQQVRVHLRDMITLQKREDVVREANAVTELGAQITKLTASFEKTITTDKERELYDEFTRARIGYLEHIKELTVLAKENADAEAWALAFGDAKVTANAEKDGIDRLVAEKIAMGKVIEQENIRVAKNARTTMVISGILGLIAAILFGIIMAMSVTKPVNKVVAVIKDIAEGEGDLTRRMNADSKDEIGELGMWFDTFLDKLDAILYQVASSTAQIASATQELASTAEEMAAGAEEQTSQTSQVATSMEEMSATVQQVAKNSGTAAGKAKGAGETAGKGGAVVNDTVQGMDRIAQTVKELQGVILGLSRNSEKIGDIVGVIDDVADQTNLLALNAAIEAARAGEQGRGFSVVADEVRKLAERTTASTKEIASMVKSIQEDTGKAVGSMDVSVKEVQTGVDLANQAGRSLQEIESASKSVQEMVQQIATAAEQQSAAAEEISSNVESIASVSKQNASAAQQTSTASQEISRLTDGLEMLVSKFKLKKAVEKVARKQIAAPAPSKFDLGGDAFKTAALKKDKQLKAGTMPQQPRA